MDTSVSTPKTPSTPNSKKVFSPVTVASSPVSKICQKGNLTGLPRNVRDLIAEFYSLLQSWESHHLEGTVVITKITSLNLFEGSKRDYNLDGKLQAFCDLLEQVYLELNKVVQMMTRVKRELEVMSNLADVRQKNYDLPESPMFLTWPFSKFVETVAFITNYYQQEVDVRRMVVEKVGLSQDLSEYYFYEACWTQQPMLFQDVITLKIEAALLETGLR
ncbi:uncharacterized protein LOC132197707 [Neocloeon triangulifer]|uniref:uncharacterized protein LOC132197707 n=1 Tax=Neocloeon triangulifer TaxID=2078957 RepID=UPI00286F4BA1|nr:uncharacterized protein LOC132197707 [Neocloeon triangulifer]